MKENITVNISQSVAILIDGNNIELSLHNIIGEENALLDFNKIVPKLLVNRGLNRLIYFREGKSISSKLADRLLNDFHGSVMPCHKSADIPLTIKATQIAKKVDTIIILSGDADYVELVRHLRGEGVRVEIAAVKQTTARILIDEADHFTPITKEDCYILKSGYRPKTSSTKKVTRKTTTPKTTATKTKVITNSQAVPTPKRTTKPKGQAKTQPKTTPTSTTKERRSTKSQKQVKTQTTTKTKATAKSKRKTKANGQTRNQKKTTTASSLPKRGTGNTSPKQVKTPNKSTPKAKLGNERKK